MTRFGVDQINKPCPQWTERILNALIIIIMPAVATFVLAIPPNLLNADKKNLVGAGTTFLIALLKALQVLCGEDKTTTNE